MGIVIVAGAIGAPVIAVLIAAIVRLTHRPDPVAEACPRTRQPGRYVGAACRCGHGQLQFRWRHGIGQTLGCSNYPVCRVAYQFNGRTLPTAQKQALLQVR
jgi:hypothetical protein